MTCVYIVNSTIQQQTVRNAKLKTCEMKFVCQKLSCILGYNAIHAGLHVIILLHQRMRKRKFFFFNLIKKWGGDLICVFTSKRKKLITFSRAKKMLIEFILCIRKHHVLCRCDIKKCRKNVKKKKFHYAFCLSVFLLLFIKWKMEIDEKRTLMNSFHLVKE